VKEEEKVSLYPMVITTLGFFAIPVFAGGLVLVVMMVIPGSRRRLGAAFQGQERHPIFWACLLASTAMASSLYLSEVVGFAPCTLCWYQRFAMYPLVLILAIGSAMGDPRVWRVGLPLSVVGLAISIYHVFIQWQPALDVVACVSDAPCTGRYVAVFGFVSIPTMAGSVFLAITGLLLTVQTADRGRAISGGV
jgi:disulfide bond formation protein DsbB